MKVLVVGAGMYVTGRHTATGLGTVLPALAQASRGPRRHVDGVTVCATRPEGEAEVSAAAARVNAALGTSLAIGYRTADALLSDRAALAEHACAVVSVPDDLHHRVTKPLLEAGLHVLVVKPLAPTVREAVDLVRTARAHRRLGVVELHKRYDEANLVVRRMLEDGRLGTPAFAAVEFSQRASIPLTVFRAWAPRTNVFQYLGVHYVDLFWFMTRLRPVRAMALGTRGILAARGVDTYDSVHAVVEWERGFVTQLAVSWIDPEGTTAMSEQRYVLVGSAGRVDCDQKNRGVQVLDARGAEAVNPYFSRLRVDVAGTPTFGGYGIESIVQFVEDIAAIEAGAADATAFAGRRPTFDDAVVSTAVVEAVNASLAARGDWRPVDATVPT